MKNKILSKIGVTVLSLAMMGGISYQVSQKTMNAPTVKASESMHYRFCEEMPRSIHHKLSNDDTSSDKVHTEITFKSKPYFMNVIVKVPAGEFGGNTQEVLIDSDALKVLKHYDLSGIAAARITIETPLQNDMGSDVGYKPVDFYIYKPSIIKQMHPDYMSNSDLANVAILHKQIEVKE